MYQSYTAEPYTKPLAELAAKPEYLVYTALLSQTGTAAPTVIVLENTIGPIVWGRNGVGEYFGTLSGAFVLGKTFSLLSNIGDITGDNIKIELRSISLNGFNLSTYTTILSDNILFKTPIEIRVYP